MNEYVAIAWAITFYSFISYFLLPEFSSHLFYLIPTCLGVPDYSYQGCWPKVVFFLWSDLLASGTFKLNIV